MGTIGVLYGIDGGFNFLQGDEQNQGGENTTSTPVGDGTSPERPGDLPVGPDEGVDEQQTAQFVETLRQQAVVASTVTIADSCTLTPRVVQLDSGSALTLQNEGAAEHEVSMALEGNNQAVIIPAGESREIEIGLAGGIFGITCDGIESGFVLVEGGE